MTHENRYNGGVYDEYGVCVYPGQANYNSLIVAARPAVAVGGVGYVRGVPAGGAVAYRRGGLYSYRNNWGRGVYRGGGGRRPGRPVMNRPVGIGRGVRGRGGRRG